MAFGVKKLLSFYTIYVRSDFVTTVSKQNEKVHSFMTLKEESLCLQELCIYRDTIAQR